MQPILRRDGDLEVILDPFEVNQIGTSPILDEELKPLGAVLNYIPVNNVTFPEGMQYFSDDPAIVKSHKVTICLDKNALDEARYGRASKSVGHKRVHVYTK